MPNKYLHILNTFSKTIFAITHDKFAEIHQFLLDKANGVEATTTFEAKARPSASVKGTVAVIPLQGVISYRADSIEESSGIVSAEKWGKQFDSYVNDDSIKAIVIKIDSPGGTVQGVPELAQKIFDARAKKHIVAVADPFAASAAYWIASQADEFIVSPSGEVGSIGVFTSHKSYKKALDMAGIEVTIIKAGDNKAEGTPFEPLSEDTKAYIQSQVDEYYNQFVSAVARGRGITTKEVNANFGQGRMFMAKEAKKLGMVDRVETFEDVMNRLVGTGNTSIVSAKSYALNERNLKVLENS